MTLLLEFESLGRTSEITPLYYLLANVSMSHARMAPKLVLPDASKSLRALSLVLGLTGASCSYGPDGEQVVQK